MARRAVPLETQTYILIANTGSAAAHGAGDAVARGGRHADAGHFTIAPNSRFNVNAGEVFPQRGGPALRRAGREHWHGTADRGRALDVTNAGGVIWAAGTNALATRLQ